MNRLLLLTALALVNIIHTSANAKQSVSNKLDKPNIAPPPSSVYDKEGRVLGYVDVVPFWVYTTVLSEISPEDNELAITRKWHDPSTTPQSLRATDLKNCSIKVDAINKKVFVHPSSLRVGCDFRIDRVVPPAPLTHWYMVSKPNSKLFSAVIGTVDGAPPVLNPSQYFVYGQVPRLKELSAQEADELWGDGNYVSSNERPAVTYRLLSTNQKNEKTEFLLDLVFANNRVEKYRIRGEKIDPKFLANWRVPGAESIEGRREW